MNIGEQIRTYRKSHNLTQEQVADALGVTAPAVNKWERAGSFPDITLLPALARLLEIDMNTLFSFHEELTEIEIANFVNALYERALTGEIAEAFADAQERSAIIHTARRCSTPAQRCFRPVSRSLPFRRKGARNTTRASATGSPAPAKATTRITAQRPATSWRCWRSPRATTTAPRNSSPGCQTRLRQGHTPDTAARPSRRSRWRSAANRSAGARKDRDAPRPSAAAHRI